MSRKKLIKTSVNLSPELLEHLDYHRGTESRERVIRDALAQYLDQLDFLKGAPPPPPPELKLVRSADDE